MDQFRVKTTLTEHLWWLLLYITTSMSGAKLSRG